MERFKNLYYKRLYSLIKSDCHEWEKRIIFKKHPRAGMAKSNNEGMPPVKFDGAKAHNKIGIAFYSKGQFDNAIKAYEKALKINPEHIKVRNNLKIALFDKGAEIVLGLLEKSDGCLTPQYSKYFEQEYLQICQKRAG